MAVARQLAEVRTTTRNEHNLRTVMSDPRGMVIDIDTMLR
jgi:hypothetical protein